MARYIHTHNEKMPWIISADLIYDYFSPLFRKDVNNEYIHNQWLNAEYALSKCENDSERIVIKALAIILIVNQQNEISANDRYLRLASDIDECAIIIQRCVVQRTVIYIVAGSIVGTLDEKVVYRSLSCIQIFKIFICF